MLNRDEFRPHVLTALVDGEPRHIKDIAILAAKKAGLTDEQLNETLPSGQLTYMNRVGWACTGLLKSGLLTRPKRGVYRITENGRVVEKRRLSSYSERDMFEWPEWVAYQSEVAERKGKNRSEAGPLEEPSEEQDPIELLAAGEQSFNIETATDLRKRLQESSPEFFEKAVIEVLWAMGYGGAHGEKKHVGRANDGGIDGVIQQDALGLSNVYIQAKRYSDTNKVGSPEVRNFIGALDSHGATLGVFITTSDFLPSAVSTADRYRHGKIVLINGKKLTSLMLDYGVAVHKAREFVLYEVDDDFFDEDLV